MKNSFFTILITLIFLNVNAQVYLNGIDIHANPGSVIYINEDSLLLDNDALFVHDGQLLVDKDLVNNDGLLQNTGIIDINENVINNDDLEGTGATGEFYIQGNWINNSNFIPGQSNVFLDGNQQNIQGSQNTSFYNLSCLGSTADIKSLIGVDATVLNNLSLGDVEFATVTQSLSVSNPDVAAILRQNGFVSSLGNGRLNRSTNTTNEYLYPVGSNDLSIKYRPIIISPSTTNNEIYGVRFADIDATSEGFDLEELKDSLCLINPEFYHRIYGNQAADIEMFYQPAEDGNWTDMAHWQNSPQWEDMGSETNNTSSSFTSMKINNWSNFSFPAYALAISKPFLDLGNNIEASQNIDVNLDPIYIGQNPDNISWTPAENLDCEDCLNTVANLFETTNFVLSINEGTSCAVRDSITVTIIPDLLYLPTGFSPNNDGVNDAFRPINTNIESIEMMVFNRWGEMIFETTTINAFWDGTYKGVLQNPGVYTYFVDYRLNGQEKNNTQKGNITLLR